MWVSWKQPTWQREYQVTRPCDKKGPGVFKDQQSFQGPEVTVSGVQWVRERIVGNIRGETDKTVLCHIKDFDLYSE